MNILGIILLVSAVAVCGYLTYSLIQDIRLKIKSKQGDSEK